MAQCLEITDLDDHFAACSPSLLLRRLLLSLLQQFLPRRPILQRKLTHRLAEHADLCVARRLRQVAEVQQELVESAASHSQASRSTDYQSVQHNQASCLTWSCNGQGVGSRHKRSQVRLPAIPLSANNLGQVVHAHACLCHHKQYSLVPDRGR